MINRFKNSIDGSMATIAAIMLPVFLGVMGLASDYMMYFDQQSKLQEAVDSAALASVKELSLAGSKSAKSTQLQEISEGYLHSTFYGSADAPKDGSVLQVITKPDIDNGQVTVEASYKWAPMFAQLFDARVTPIKASATAKLTGDALTCIIGLMQPQRLAKASIHLDNRAVIHASKCAVYSNSVSRYGLRADKDARMFTRSSCTAGGVITFGRAHFEPEPITDCPVVQDPLAKRATPIVGACTHNALVITEDTILEEGVYCNGLTISGNAVVRLAKGVYTIKDGPLIVTDKASLIAEEASFFLTGDKSEFEFHADTTINLSAMTQGPLAGLLVFEDRTVPHSFDFNPFFLKSIPEKVRIHRITSNNARNLLGTIYVSKSILLIDADAPVADGSAYTAIIAGRLWLREGPILTLNADYTNTAVPVPDGMIGTEPALVR